MQTSANETVLLREYVGSGKLMQLATDSGDGQPWLVHVWYAAGTDLRLVFASNVARAHSAHIKAGSKVAGGIIANELEGLGQKVRGVTFTGLALECTGDDLDEAYRVYATRWPKANEHFPLARIASGDTPMRLYQVNPDQFVLFDEVNYPDEPRRVITEW